MKRAFVRTIRMKRTATNQVNLDYNNEQDAIRKMRVILAVTPFAAAMFANSAFSYGELNDFQSDQFIDFWTTSTYKNYRSVIDYFKI